MVETLVERLREAANEIALEGAAGWGNTCADAADRLDELERQLAEAERRFALAQQDVERYRWLRQMIFDDSIIVAPDRMLHGDALDAAIDAAIRALPDEGQT